MTGQPYTPPQRVSIPFGQAGYAAAEEWRREHPGEPEPEWIVGTPLHDAGASDGAPATDDE